MRVADAATTTAAASRMDTWATSMTQDRPAGRKTFHAGAQDRSVPVGPGVASTMRPQAFRTPRGDCPLVEGQAGVVGRALPSVPAAGHGCGLGGRPGLG